MYRRVPDSWKVDEVTEKFIILQTFTNERVV